jgi:plasmid maintenance system antidote protein VapI
MIRKRKQIANYYFANPNANSMKEMVAKFKVSPPTIKKIISNELDLRLENSLTRRMIKKHSK